MKFAYRGPDLTGKDVPGSGHSKRHPDRVVLAHGERVRIIKQVGEGHYMIKKVALSRAGNRSYRHIVPAEHLEHIQESMLTFEEYLQEMTTKRAKANRVKRARAEQKTKRTVNKMAGPEKESQTPTSLGQRIKKIGLAAAGSLALSLTHAHVPHQYAPQLNDIQAAIKAHHSTRERIGHGLHTYFDRVRRRLKGEKKSKHKKPHKPPDADEPSENRNKILGSIEGDHDDVASHSGGGHHESLQTFGDFINEKHWIKATKLHSRLMTRTNQWTKPKDFMLNAHWAGRSRSDWSKHVAGGRPLDRLAAYVGGAAEEMGASLRDHLDDIKEFRWRIKQSKNR